MSAEAQRIWMWIGRHIWQIFIFGSFFIQISPIKINPLSWLGKVLVSEACGKMDTLIEDVKALDKEIKENEKDRIRWEILDFANSCHSGVKHTKDEFKHIIELNDKYNILLTKTKDENGVFKAEYTYIKKLYDKLNETNAFITIGGNENE